MQGTAKTDKYKIIRYLISPDKDRIIEESRKGLIEKHPEELLKNPYIFEFAGLKEKQKLSKNRFRESFTFTLNRIFT